MNEDNEKKFKKYITDYYETFLIDWKNRNELDYTQGFTGQITESNGDGMLSYSILNDQAGVDLNKYTHDGNDTTQWYYELPQDIGDKLIMSCFDMKSVDHSKINFYNSAKKSYIVSGCDFYNDLMHFTQIRSIKQIGDVVIAKADIYEVTMKKDEAVPDLSKKPTTVKVTFIIENEKYLYEKVEKL